MIKLQAALCPQCGANIEVNPELEKTICQYCGTTILIDDAVQKYKIELSGKVKVDGVKNRDDHLEQAKKHFKVGEYLEAKECLSNIIKDDTFDIEAYCEIMKNDIALIKEADYNPYCSRSNKNYNETLDGYFNDFSSVYERVKKIDENNESSKYLGDYAEDVQKYGELSESIKKQTTRNAEILKQIEKDRIKVWDTRRYKPFMTMLSECFKISDVIDTLDYKKNATNMALYELSELRELRIDGFFIGNYIWKERMFGDDCPVEINLHPNRTVPAMNADEMEARIQDYLEKSKAFFDPNNKDNKKGIFGWLKKKKD